MSMRALAATGLISMAIFAAGCGYRASFAFPVDDGSIGSGRVAFIAHRCQRCHTVADDPMPELAGAASPRFELGGETSNVKAYSDLVTSIINPNHRISERYQDEVLRQPTAPLESPMQPRYIDTMTVGQLIDIVAYLDSKYVLVDDYDADF